MASTSAPSHNEIMNTAIADKIILSAAPPLIVRIKTEINAQTAAAPVIQLGRLFTQKYWIALKTTMIAPVIIALIVAPPDIWSQIGDKIIQTPINNVSPLANLD